MNKKYIGALVGNIMQFYDFTIYAFLTHEISACFFEVKEKFIAHFIVLSIFAIGYFTRPLGALLFGYLGDRKGRSRALSKTIILSTASTFLIGITPGYQTLGYAAPIALILLRLLQGLSVSGEEGGAVVLLFEKNAFKNQGLLGALILSSVLVGVVLGIFVCAGTSYLLDHHWVGDWGWRIPFLLSLPMGIFSIAMRFYLNDFELFNKAKTHQIVESKVVRGLFQNHAWALAYGLGLVAIYSITTSLLIVHLPYYLTIKLQMTREVGLLAIGLSLLFITMMTPVIGRYIDRFDSVKVYGVGALGVILFSPIFFFMLANGYFVVGAILIFSCWIAILSAALFSLLVRLFPFGVRYSGVSIVFNTSITIFSSTTPLVLMALEGFSLNPILPGLYVSVLSSLMFGAMYFFRKKIRTTDFSQHLNERFLYVSAMNEKSSI